MTATITHSIGQLSSLLTSRLSWALPQGQKKAEQSGKLSVTDSRTGRSYEVPIVRNAIRATDFRMMTAAGVGAELADHIDTGLKVYDPGYQNTAVVESKVTYIDGKRGTIQYRQYPIEKLFNENTWEEVIHLLIWGHLPSRVEKETFRKGLAAASVPPPSVIKCIQALPRNAPAFTMITAGFSAWAAEDPDTAALHVGKKNFMGDVAAIDKAIVTSLAAGGVIVALTYCHQLGKEFTPADPDAGYVYNVLRMMGFNDPVTGKPNPRTVGVLERLWVLYADHEMTNSTAAFLHAASTLTDPLSCSISGMVSAFGPLHGGAIDLAYEAFDRIGSPANVPKLIADVKAKKMRLFGYGHRIYRTVDPRARFIRQMMSELDEEVKKNPLLNIALEIDRIASQDEYFTSRNLKANADLFGCFLYTALGFEKEIITPMATISRAPGVFAHWREAMTQQPRLWRPLQIFTGQVN